LIARDWGRRSVLLLEAGVHDVRKVRRDHQKTADLQRHLEQKRNASVSAHGSSTPEYI
jgi:hypothetical protein